MAVQSSLTCTRSRVLFCCDKIIEHHNVQRVHLLALACWAVRTDLSLHAGMDDAGMNIVLNWLGWYALIHKPSGRRVGAV